MSHKKSPVCFAVALLAAGAAGCASNDHSRDHTEIVGPRTYLDNLSPWERREAERQINEGSLNSGKSWR